LVSPRQAAATQAVGDSIEQEVKAIQGQMIAWRRQIHQNPELGNREVRTSSLVAAQRGAARRSANWVFLICPMLAASFPFWVQREVCRNARPRPLDGDAFLPALDLYPLPSIRSLAAASSATVSATIEGILLPRAATDRPRGIGLNRAINRKVVENRKA
jgi:hypothetical protein